MVSWLDVKVIGKDCITVSDLLLKASNLLLTFIAKVKFAVKGCMSVVKNYGTASGILIRKIVANCLVITSVF